MAKKLFIKTYGCQMNVYDSARMADVLAPLGFEPTETPRGADMVILNTCHIREKAAEKVFSELGRLRRHKQERESEGERMIIAVAGCVAQAEGREIVRRAPQVDVVLGPQTYHRLPEMVAQVLRGLPGGGILETDFPAESKFDYLPEKVAPQGAAAFLSVQEGCDKFCTFCVVPYTRGAEYSRPVADVVAEARKLVDAGALEVTLLGQNVNAYHGAYHGTYPGAYPGAYHGETPGGGTWGLARLIRGLAEIDGLERLRYTTSHPRDMDDDLIAAHGDVDKLMPYLHLPVQSGSDRVLEAMNRRHRADDYRRITDRLRGARPDLALSSDFIVGFPGESDRDFAETLRLVTDIGYAQAYSFKYSPRPGTPAAGAELQVPEPVKVERLAMIQSLLGEQQAAFNRASLHKTMPVLFERRGKQPGQLVGRSPYMQAVHALAPDRVMHRLANVRIEAGHAKSLAGRLSSGDPGGSAPRDLPSDGADVAIGAGR